MGKLTDFLKKQPAPTEMPSPAPVAQGMPKLTIAFDRQSIEVNGIVFTLLKSDADILDDALRLIEKSEKLDTKDSRAVLENLHEMASYIDSILGEGALKKISGGAPVGFLKMQECMSVIVGAVYTAYQTSLAAKYGD